MELKTELKKALEELRKSEERKFNQTVDLIINLQKFNVKKETVNTFVILPFPVKEKKIAAFLETKHPSIETITPDDFKRYNDKKELKKLVNNFDFFIAQASVMPKVATVFGKVLGPAGKMPSPQLGIIMDANEKTIKELKEKVNKSVKLRTKEPTLKLAVGKQSMKDEEIIENILIIYNTVLKSLTKGNDNIKNVEVKFTMTKPVKIILK
ncbi:hypothetical protein HY212_03585 [Candidatus Pacearchaeota archaeon]|nr:hypothetical protein [Candidatus Pacearchaeota archaeon]